MTDEQIIEMARQVIDIDTDKRGRHTFVCDEYGLKAFANLVAQHERERIFSELFEMHLKAQRIHNHYLHAVMHIKAKDKARGEA